MAAQQSVSGDEQWIAAGKMVLEMRQLDLDTKKEHQGIGSAFALRAREDAIKRDHHMEAPEELLELAEQWDPLNEGMCEAEDSIEQQSIQYHLLPQLWEAQ